MKLYQLTKSSIDEYEVCGVFTTEDLAKKALKDITDHLHRAIEEDSKEEWWSEHYRAIHTWHEMPDGSYQTPHGDTIHVTEIETDKNYFLEWYGP